MKKALFTATVLMFFPFLRNDIRLLEKLGYEISCATNMSKHCRKAKDMQLLDELTVEKNQIEFPRSPFSLGIFTAYNQLKKLIIENHFDLIHCHTPVGGILTRLAARKCRKQGTKVIYTAHGFHFYKGAPLINWLIYYPAEKVCAHFTDCLITINKEDYALAQRKMKAKKVEYVPGVGIDLSRFNSNQITCSQKRKELSLSENDIALLSVGEVNQNKNHKLVIQAMAKMSNSHTHYYIAGKGPLENELKNLAEQFGLANRIHLLGYRNDVKELFEACDIFCFPSYREGLSVALMEAMAMGLPCVATNIRGNVDLIENGLGGFLHSPNNIDGFVQSFQILCGNKELRDEMGRVNREKIKEFELSVVQQKMQEIYREFE